MSLLPLSWAAVLISIATGLVYASPTSADYSFCHRKAALSLQICLDQHKRGESRDCWLDGRRANERCYASVLGEFSEDKKKTEAMRRAKAESASARAKIKDARR